MSTNGMVPLQKAIPDDQIFSLPTSTSGLVELPALAFPADEMRLDVDFSTCVPEQWAEPPALLVCATGGHLAQLHRMASRLDVVAGGSRLWVTFDSPQSRSLLAGEPTIFVPYTGPRDARNALLNTRFAYQLLRQVEVRAVISTGAAIAMSFLPIARSFGRPAIYIERAARADGPSLTGRMLEFVPGVKRYTQYSSWEGRQWTYVGSVFDEFEGALAPAQNELRRIVVTLGTIEGYGFPRLLRRVKEIVPAGVEVVWQVGDTQTTDLQIDGIRSMPARELAREITDADVVIAHAGIGSALGALDAGKCPVLVPRLASHAEHVDDHQIQIASELERRGLAVRRHVEELHFEDLVAAGRREVRRVDSEIIRTGV